MEHVGRKRELSSSSTGRRRLSSSRASDMVSFFGDAPWTESTNLTLLNPSTMPPIANGLKARDCNGNLSNEPTPIRRRRLSSRRSVGGAAEKDRSRTSIFLISCLLVVVTAIASGVIVSMLQRSRNTPVDSDKDQVWLQSIASDVLTYSKKTSNVDKAFRFWPSHHDNDGDSGHPYERQDLWGSEHGEVAKRHPTSLQQANYLSQSPDGEEKRNRAAEAAASLHAAMDMWEGGKMTKAMRLFQHALALVNDDPEILIAYGEFLEKYENNYLQADHYYSRALVLEPRHSRAVANKKRTAPVVAELDFQALSRIDEKRAELAKLPDSHAALRRIKKEAYFQYVYHTVGIEGNTMTLSQTRSILETRMAIGGKSVMEHNEILGMDAALRYVNQTLLNRIGTITVQDILEIHRKVMGMVDPDVAGVYRRTQVFVSKHVPPPADRVSALMDDLVAWLNSPSALEAHPMNYAALAHYKLVYIHPFVDGNGRTARLFMNWILMQEGYPPVIIRKQDRSKYYDTLQHANEGDVRPFLRFIADCAEKTLDVYLWATRETSTRGIQALPYEDDGVPAIFHEEERR